MPLAVSMTGCKREVDAMVDRGESFDAIEAYIDSTLLSPEGKTVLWLLAWGHQPEHVRESTLAESLAAVAG